MVRYRRAIPVLLYQSASTVCAGINSSQRQGQRSLHIILSSFRIKLRGWERMCKKTLFAMQTFQSIFCNIWKRMEETRCHCSESGYLYTRPEKKKAGDVRALSEQLRKSNNQSKGGQVNLRADLSFFVILKILKSVLKHETNQNRNLNWSGWIHLCCNWTGTPQNNFWQKQQFNIAEKQDISSKSHTESLNDTLKTSKSRINRIPSPAETTTRPEAVTDPATPGARSGDSFPQPQGCWQGRVTYLHVG